MRRVGALLILIALTVTGCAPGNTAETMPTRTEPVPDRTAVIVTHVEPTILTGHNAFRVTGSAPTNALRLFNAALAITDDPGTQSVEPYLAERLPQLDTGTWRLFPDGRMETTYTLRSGLTWHDGAPLTADDFVLSWRALKTPEFGVAETIPAKLMVTAEARDSRTLVVQWSGPYPRADQMSGGIEGALGSPLPSHILGEPFAQLRPEQFAALPYFTRDYVGLGPYRLTRWEPGAFIEGAAFEGHALGRPKIDRVKIIFVGDPNSALAHLLSGEAQLAVDFALGFEQTALLRRQWASTNGGTIFRYPRALRYVQIQFKEEYTNPREILDLRVRQGLWAGINRQAFVDGLLDGDGTPAETMGPPSAEYYAAAERLIERHPYDPNRAQQLLSEAGLTRAPDGMFLKRDGERFAPELRATASGQTQREATILADSWRRIGVDVRERYLSEAEDSDREVRSTYPSFATADTNVPDSTLIGKLYSPNAATPANRWNGVNRGGYVNMEFDRLYDVLVTSFKKEERNDAMASIMQLVNREVPVFPLYFNDLYRAHTSALQPPPYTQLSEVGVKNIHEWRWRS